MTRGVDDLTFVHPFGQAGTPLKSARVYRPSCSNTRPCKRIKYCVPCARHRGAFFVSRGARYAKLYELDTLVTISWSRIGDHDPWSILLRNSRALTVARLSRSQKYIRVLAMGEVRDRPHVHLLIGEAAGETIQAFSRRRWDDCLTHGKPVHEPDRVLGYMYDMNFLPTFRRPDRPLRIRLLSASKGMPCGFPRSG
jgi:hypothetical protein